MTQEQHNPLYQDRRAPIDVGWHLKKEVNLTIIISVIGIAVAAVTGYSDLKKEIALIQADVVVLHQRDTQTSSELREALSLMRQQFDRMDSKLDRLVERSK